MISLSPRITMVPADFAGGMLHGYVLSDRFGTLYEACGSVRGAVYRKAPACVVWEMDAALQFLDGLQLEQQEWSVLLQALNLGLERPFLDAGDHRPDIARLICQRSLEFRRLPTLDYKRGVPGERGLKYCFVPGPTPLPNQVNARHVAIGGPAQAQKLLGTLDFSKTEWDKLFKTAGRESVPPQGSVAGSKQLLASLLASKQVLAYAVRPIGAAQERGASGAAAAAPEPRQKASPKANPVQQAPQPTSMRAPDPPATSKAPPPAAAPTPAPPAPQPTTAATAKDFALPKSPADAPAQVDLSAMQKQYDQLWANSFPGGRALENGGTLVSDAKGALSLANPGSGTAGTFTPNLAVAAQQKVLGVFHTHPYDATEGSYTGISLSGGDAGYMLVKQQNAIIAQSGTEQFMYLRTAASPTTVNAAALDAAQNNRIGALMASGKDFSEASKIAAQETAKAQGLAYYEGSGGVLKRVYP